ncbi:MAG: ATP-binding protein [Defluviitaleaceae bacterium]|nr:ATP-binding protein [Defluviitaleaceae bacterium]
MTDMKVSKKLTVSFFIMIALTVLIGAVGIIGMMQINAGSREMYESQSQPLSSLGMAREYFQRLRVQLRDVVLASGNISWLDIIEADLYNHERGFINYMERYSRTIKDAGMIELYNEIMTAFDEYQPSMQQILASARVDAPPVQMLVMMDALIEPTDFIMDALYYLAHNRVLQASYVNEINSLWFNMLFIMIIAAIALGVAVGLLVTKYVSVLSKLEFSRLADENAALESLSRMKSEYLANISHETKTPLTIISVNVQLAADLYEESVKEPTEDGKIIGEALRRAQEAILRVKRMTENNLWLASRREVREKMTVIEISKFLTSSAEIHRRVIEKGGSRLVINIPDDLNTFVYGSADSLVQVMDNLLANAYNHTKNGEICVNAELKIENGEFVTVSVVDNGTGISRLMLPRVFERGVTGDVGLSGSEGTGLGLAICKNIIESHGGDIWVESEAGKGTTVTFTVPIYNEGVRANA